MRNIDIHKGQYRVLSSNGTDWYLVDLVAARAAAPDGQNGFSNAHAGACRHIAAARVVAKGLHDMRAATRLVAQAPELGLLGLRPAAS